jgi:hypothetical protein
MLFIVEAPHFVAGFVLGERYAPILGYMRGWDILRITKFCEKKGWVLTSPPN